MVVGASVIAVGHEWKWQLSLQGSLCGNTTIGLHCRGIAASQTQFHNNLLHCQA